MSVNIICLISHDPTWQPTEEAAERARALFAAAFPDSYEIKMEFHEETIFVDAGGNAVSTSCPACGRDAAAWWGDAMDGAYETHFRRLDITTPCCGLATSLNELRYEWLAGFARFTLEAVDPKVYPLDESLHRELEECLGSPLRIIWRHY